MAGPKVRVQTADTEAAAWHARLGGRSVTTQEIEAFFAWRETPAHDAAYRRVEKIWAASGKLSSDPLMQQALDAALSRKTATSPAGRLPKGVLGVAAIAVVAALGFGSVAWLEARTTFITGVGEARVVQLADGSSVRLDTASRIRVRFDKGHRFVDLESGQALFTVAHDAIRPFLVRAGEARVTAVGTVFDVQREGAGASVTLVSGIVDLGAGRNGKILQRMAAGHQARVTADGAVTRPVDVETETSWTQGRIVFRDTPLRQAVAEVNRYLTDPVELDGAVRNTASVNGVFKTGDRDAFVSTAVEVFDLQASPGRNGTIRLSARGK